MGAVLDVEVGGRVAGTEKPYEGVGEGRVGVVFVIEREVRGSDSAALECAEVGGSGGGVVRVAWPVWGLVGRGDGFGVFGCLCVGGWLGLERVEVMA